MNLHDRRAALLSCHHAAYQARYNQAPAVLPARIRPLHHDVAAEMFTRATGAEGLRARGDALAILTTAPGVRHAPLLPPEQQAELARRAPERAAPRRAGGGAHRRVPEGEGTGARAGCRCCQVRAAHDRISGLPPPPALERHPPPRIEFNADRMTTTVTTALAAKVSRAEAQRLLANADPRNWKRAAADFFVASDPGVYEDGRWTARPWTRAGGLLREVVHWNWNGQNAVAFDNILRIDGLKVTETSIDYRYSLFTCLQSRLLVVWDSGGLDVDDGRYHAAYRGGVLEIEASKRVRFTAPANGPFEIALALNLMAPATLSMLMQNLVSVSRDGRSTPRKGNP